MTYAICIRCGEGKHGAFTPCRKCGFLPKTSQEQARSMVLSDQMLPKEQLDVAGAKLKAGEPILFDEPAVAQMAKDFEAILQAGPPRAVGCTVVWWSLISILVALLTTVVVLYVYIRHHAP